MHTQQGLIKFILIVIVIIIVLGYFGFNLREIMDTPTVKDNLSYVWQAIVNVWNNWLKEPAGWFWTNVWVPYIWEPFVQVMDVIKNVNQTPTGTEVSSV
jgi:hypothetical protein